MRDTKRYTKGIIIFPIQDTFDNALQEANFRTLLKSLRKSLCWNTQIYRTKVNLLNRKSGGVFYANDTQEYLTVISEIHNEGTIFILPDISNNLIDQIPIHTANLPNPTLRQRLQELNFELEMENQNKQFIIDEIWKDCIIEQILLNREDLLPVISKYYGIFLMIQEEYLMGIKLRRERFICNRILVQQRKNDQEVMPILEQHQKIFFCGLKSMRRIKPTTTFESRNSSQGFSKRK